MFPLYRYEAGQLFDGGGIEGCKVVNLSRRFIGEIVDATGLRWTESDAVGECAEYVTPADIFNYLFALLHAPGYRDFPPIPLPSTKGLFRDLVQLGGELTLLHLLESPRLSHPITDFIGVPNLKVEKISWSRDTVFIDKAQTSGFRGVAEPVWNFHIGGYQVCEKWLKDRKGRILSADHITHYQKIVVALSETIRLMSEIDEVIEKHGGWPGTFVKEKLL
jgi:predicted helicase